MGPARARLRALAPTQDRNGRESPDAFSAASRRSAGIRRFPAKRANTPVCICGEVTKTSVRRFRRLEEDFRGDACRNADANALSQPLVLRWFNLHYVQKMIATGQRLVVFGSRACAGNAFAWSIRNLK